jgi:hypothetical protein
MPVLLLCICICSLLLLCICSPPALFIGLKLSFRELCVLSSARGEEEERRGEGLAGDAVGSAEEEEAEGQRFWMQAKQQLSLSPYSSFSGLKVYVCVCVCECVFVCMCVY